MDGDKADQLNAGRPNGKRAKPPGLKEIAAYLNLSPATVSMVVNDVPLAKSLSQETRARVMAAAKHFNYRPNLVARSLSKRESRTIGVIAPESSDGYFTRVMRGVERALLDAGYLYFTTSHLGREDLIREYPNALMQRGVDGLIFLNTRIYEHPGIPSVSISHRSPIEGVTNILVNQRQGMFLALEHLVSLGHRRILIMRGAEYSSDADDRHASLLAAAERVGLTLDPELMLTLATDQLTPEGAFRAFAGVLTRKPAFTAIFAFNDLSALGAIRAMADCGLSCPEDISVLGVDDISTASFALPRLTTAAQPLEDMGAAAVEQLIRKIQKPDEPQVPRVLFPMTLMVRESTGPVSSPESRILAEKRRLHAAESQFAVTTHR